MKQTAISILIISAGFVVVFFLSGFIEGSRPRLAAGVDDEDLTVQGKDLKGYVLGAEGMLADWYWMRSLQYIGDKLVKTDAEFINLDDLRFLNARLLYPYLENVTDLDPQFIEAYSFGAVVLPAIDSEQAIKLIEKGIRNNPDQWRLHHYLGYIYWRLKRYDEASAIFARGAAIENAPPFMTMMAASMKNRGGDRETARAIYRQLYEDASSPDTKFYAEMRLAELDSYDERDAIRPLLDAFRNTNNRCPNSWQEIADELERVSISGARRLNLARSGAPIDPLGVAYLLYNREGECQVALDPAASKIPFQ